MRHASLCFSTVGPPRYWVAGDPRDLWPQEADFCRWLAASPALLAECLGLPGLEAIGREVVTGDRVAGSDRVGRLRWDGGLRADLTARDERGRTVVIEAQLGLADHGHLGQLITYATALQADVAVWAVAAAEPPFLAEHLDALAELTRAFCGSRQFAAVTVTLESDRSPVPLPLDEAVSPRVRCAGRPPPAAPARLPRRAGDRTRAPWRLTYLPLASAGWGTGWFHSPVVRAGMTMLWICGCGSPCGLQWCSNDATTQRWGLAGENRVRPAVWSRPSAS